MIHYGGMNFFLFFLANLLFVVDTHDFQIYCSDYIYDMFFFLPLCRSPSSSASSVCVALLVYASLSLSLSLGLDWVDFRLLSRAPPFRMASGVDGGHSSECVI